MDKDLIIAKQKELIAKLQSMVDSGQDYDLDYHEIWVELQVLKSEPVQEKELSDISPNTFSGEIPNLINIESLNVGGANTLSGQEPLYTLYCDKCNKIYKSKQAFSNSNDVQPLLFVKPQVCKDCDNKELGRAMKWILIKDQIPPDYERVLWIDKRDGLIGLAYFVWSQTPVNYLTHWMSLPQKPDKL